MQRTETETPVVVTPPEQQKRAHRRKKRSHAWLWLLAAAALAYGAYRYMEGSQQPRGKQEPAAAGGAHAGPRAISVAAVPAHLGDMPIYLRGLGNVAPLNNVVVKTRVDGELMSVHFIEGQFVKEGQLLAEIDPRPFEVQLQQAEGQLARDLAQLNDAKVNLQRYETLWKQQIVPQQQRDTAAAAVGQFEGSIKADQAAIANARLQLTYARVTAPLSGRIGLRQVDPGNIVHAGDPNGLVTIAQIQPISVLFTIPADDLPPVLKKLRSGAKLRVDAYDRDDVTRIASGTVLTVDNQIDPTTGTARIKAIFPNADGALFPSQFVNCRLLLETKRNVVIIPASAIQRGPQGTFVYVVDPGTKTVKMRPVTAAVNEGTETSIAEGLQPGDMVVVDGQDKLQDGSQVQVRAPGAGRGANNAAGAAAYGRSAANATSAPDSAGRGAPGATAAGAGGIGMGQGGENRRSGRRTR